MQGKVLNLITVCSMYEKGGVHETVNVIFPQQRTKNKDVYCFGFIFFFFFSDSVSSDNMLC